MKIFGITGWSGSGKTTLIEALIPLITARGLKISMVKSAHHDVDVDKPGKDSYRFREAGASQVILACGKRWALMEELRENVQPSLMELVSYLSPCDLVLVEGYKSAGHPKIVVFRASLGKPLFEDEADNVLAIASDLPVQTHLPVLDLNDPAAVAKYILDQTGLA